RTAGEGGLTRIRVHRRRRQRSHGRAAHLRDHRKGPERAAARRGTGDVMGPATHRIWIDDGKHDEASDGEDFDAHSARDAVEAWAERRYSALQHVDPGMLLVRTPRGDIERWDVSVVTSFRTVYRGIAAQPSGKGEP